VTGYYQKNTSVPEESPRLAHQGSVLPAAILSYWPLAPCQVSVINKVAYKDFYEVAMPDNFYRNGREMGQI
jgi:hypothetical protein